MSNDVKSVSRNLKAFASTVWQVQEMQARYGQLNDSRYWLESESKQVLSKQQQPCWVIQSHWKTFHFSGSRNVIVHFIL
jgi:hypothetical protein